MSSKYISIFTSEGVRQVPTTLYKQHRSLQTARVEYYSDMGKLMLRMLLVVALGGIAAVVLANGMVEIIRYFYN